MEATNIQFVGPPCGQHGPYTFFKSLKYTHGKEIKKLSLGEFFFVEISPQSPVCIGELQLLWYDKNHPDHRLSSVRLYFKPEDTPDGRLSHHGQDELLAEAEKIVMKVPDLIQWIVNGAITWDYGSKAFTGAKGFTEDHYPHLAQVFATNNCALKFQSNPDDLQAERITNKGDKEGAVNRIRDGDQLSSKSVVILSYSQYCRFRSVLKRLQNCTNAWLKHLVVCALGGFTVQNADARIMFCRDVFEHPLLEDHDFRQDHLVPLLKGRKRKKLSFKKESESDTNESECSIAERNSLSCSSKDSLNDEFTAAATLLPRVKVEKCLEDTIKQSNNKVTEGNNVKVLRPNGLTRTSPEEEKFLKNLFSFMNSYWKPIERLPTLGFREVDLYLFFTLVQKRGGHAKVGQSRLWKHIYDLLGGNPANTSAATCTRRLYEKLLLPYEQYLRYGEKALPKKSEVEEKISIKRNTTHLTRRDNSPSSDTHPSNGLTEPATKCQKGKHTVQEILNKQHKQTLPFTNPSLSIKHEAPPTHSMATPTSSISSAQSSTHYSYLPKEHNHHGGSQKEIHHNVITPTSQQQLVGQPRVLPPNYVVVSSSVTPEHSVPVTANQAGYTQSPHMSTSDATDTHRTSRPFTHDASLLPYTRPSVIQHMPNGITTHKTGKSHMDVTSPFMYSPAHDGHKDRGSNSHKRPYPFVNDIKSAASHAEVGSPDNLPTFVKHSESSLPSNPKQSRGSNSQTTPPVSSKTSDYIDQLRQARRSQKQGADENCAPLDLSKKSSPASAVLPTKVEPQDAPIDLCKKPVKATYEGTHKPVESKPSFTMALAGKKEDGVEVTRDLTPFSSQRRPSTSNHAQHIHQAQNSHKHLQLPQTAPSSPQTLVGPSHLQNLASPASFVHPAFPGFASPTPGQNLLSSHLASQFVYPLMPPPVTADKNAQSLIPHFLYNAQSAGAFLIPSIPLYTPPSAGLPQAPTPHQSTHPNK